MREAYTQLVDQRRSENGLLREQLAVKDEQIRANQVSAAQLTDPLKALHALPSPDRGEKDEQAPEQPMPVLSRPAWQSASVEG